MAAAHAYPERQRSNINFVRCYLSIQQLICNRLQQHVDVMPVPSLLYLHDSGLRHVGDLQ